MTLRLPSLRTTFLSAAALALSACSGDGASLQFSVHPQGVSAHSLDAFAQKATSAADSVAPPSFQSADGVKFSLSQARIHLRDIRLDLPQGSKCADVRELISGAECKGGETGSGSNTLVIRGPIVADLMSGATTPDISGVVLPAGTYKRIDFRLEEGHADELPAGESIIGYSLLVGANFTEQAGKRLELRLKFSEDARFESATGVEIPEGGSLIAMLNPAVWLNGLPLGICIQKGDVAFEGDTLRIDDRSKGECSGAEDLVKRNIKTSGDLRKSED
jgi:hypothetical protein